ncbi:MAG TPA: universal stress protein [Candidatus Obscuribacterales bacterium]
MINPSILLALSASEQSRFAAELCWALAAQTGARVTAQHVVDSRGAWDLLGHDRPGFLGSGMFVTAHEQLVAALYTLGGKLLEVYDAHASARAIRGESVLDEGNPVREICRRAPEHDLVVIGHKPSTFESPEDERRKSLRFSVAESLAHECPRPLLVVQERCEPWSDMRILLSLRHVNQNYIHSCLQMASTLRIDPEIVGLSTGIHEEDATTFAANLRQQNPDLSHVPINVTRLSDTILNPEKCAWWTSEEDIEADALPDTLLVMPTRELEGRRLTVYGSSPAFFIRHLKLPCILLWPEESPDHFSADTRPSPEGSTVPAS